MIARSWGFESSPSHFQIMETTRRNLLKRTVGGLFLTSSRPNESLSPSESNSESLLKESIERKYNIKIKTLKELFLSQNKPFYSGVAQSPDEWDMERLKILDGILEILPPHFYQIGTSGRKMRVTLGIASTEGLFSTIGDGYQNQIELDYKRFDPIDPRLCLIDTTHEFTHLLVPENMEIVEYKTSDGINAKKVIFKSPWYDAVEQILGESFATLAPKMRQRILDFGYIFVPNKGIARNPNLPNSQTEEEKEDAFADEFDYGFRKDYPGEFIPVLAQTYIQGEEYFFTMYGRYLDQSQVEQLYEFTKKNIFRQV